jgi:RimJ/RimL family protein N-acetyltransferase
MTLVLDIPVLETERLVLRAPQVSDWPAFWAFRQSTRTIFVGGVKKEHEAAQQFASFLGHWVMRGFGRLIAVDRATGAPLGHFGPMQWEEGAEVEFTWSLWSAKAEGKGFATEAARAIRDWSFGPLGLRHACAEVHSDNTASHAIARTLGGQVVPGLAPRWVADGSVYRFTAGGAA